MRAESSIEVNDLDGVVPDSDERKRVLTILHEMCEELGVEYNQYKIYAIVKRLVKYFTTLPSWLLSFCIILQFICDIHIG